MRLKTIRPPLHQGVIIILFVLSTSAATFSQVRLGVKAGVQSSFSSTNDQHTYGKAGYLGGITANYELSEKLSLNGEALFSQHNMLMSRYNGSNSNTSNWDSFDNSFKTSNNKFYSFNLPVTVEYALKTSESFSLVAYLGPYATYNLKVIEHYIKTGEQDGNALTATVSGSEDVSSEFKNWVYGAAVGIKADVTVGEKFLTFDIRYNHDITPYKESFSYSGIPDTGQDLYMQMISISAGYSLFQL